MKFLIFLILTIININLINGQAGLCDFGKTGKDCSFTTQLIKSFGSYGSTAPTITFNNTINIYKIQLEKLVEFDENGAALNIFQLNNSILTPSPTPSTLNYQTALNSEATLKIKIFLNLNSNGTANFTNIEYGVTVTGYKFQSSTNKLKLFLNSTVSSIKAPTTETCSSSGVDPLKSTAVNTMFGNTILQSTFEKSNLKIDSVNKTNVVLNFVNFTNTINSTYISTTSQNVLTFPAFNTSLDYTFTYSLIVTPKPLNVSNVDYMYTTCFKITAQTGLTGQQKAAVCIGVIGFTILGGVIAYFFVLKGRYIFKEQ